MVHLNVIMIVPGLPFPRATPGQNERRVPKAAAQSAIVALAFLNRKAPDYAPAPGDIECICRIHLHSIANSKD